MTGSKIEAMRRALSSEALAALLAARDSHQGTVVTSGRPVSRALLAELRIHGAIGERDGLTVIGSLLAGRLQHEAFEAAF